MNPSPVTVSLLDDDPSVLAAMSRLLRSAGWAVRIFEDPRAFLDDGAKLKFPVALIDVSMPEMDGLEVQTRLRNLSPNTRIIFLTSRDDPSVCKKALAAGAFAFFLKPADDHKLLAAIQAATMQSSGERPTLSACNGRESVANPDDPGWRP